eukprot:jgi/Tetstr1/448438/TSEL_035707.t1
MDAFRTPAPLPVDLPITSRISVNAQHDEQLLTRNEDQQTLRAYVPDPNLPWDPDTYCAPCKSWCHGGHCKIGMLIPTAGLVKDHQCARGKAFYHVISTAPVVGDVVRVLLAKEDRGKVDPTFLTCVVTECNSYRVALDAGVIKTAYGQQDMDQFRNIAPARVGLAGVVEKWSDQTS